LLSSNLNKILLKTMVVLNCCFELQETNMPEIWLDS